MIPFNVNFKVKVKLTEHGLAILRANHLALFQFSPIVGPFEPPKLDEDGYASFHMWELMREFGPAMGMGLTVPFETSIRLVPEGPVGFWGVWRHVQVGDTIMVGSFPEEGPAKALAQRLNEADGPGYNNVEAVFTPFGPMPGLKGKKVL